MKNSYLEVANSGINELDIKKSKFIASIKPIHSEDEAQRFINQISEKNKKANHNCYAYVVGLDDHIQHATDNGEPSGTAGVPILEALTKNHLHNTVIVVTRYFGGIKLGAGGLIRAYSNSASEVIKKVGITTMILKTELIITLSYKLNDQLQDYLKKNNDLVSDVSYGEKVSVTTAVISENVDSFVKDLNNLFSANLSITKGKKKYYPDK